MINGDIFALHHVPLLSQFTFRWLNCTSRHSGLHFFLKSALEWIRKTTKLLQHTRHNLWSFFYSYISLSKNFKFLKCDHLKKYFYSCTLSSETVSYHIRELSNNPDWLTIAAVESCACISDKEKTSAQLSMQILSRVV